METLLAILLGLGLAAACGFRVFVPMFFVGLAFRTDHLDLASGFEWLGSTPALICLGSAMLMEVLAYFIPWLDNLLDSIATPAAVIAGTILSMGMVSDMSPLLHWTLGIVVGGGSAAAVQAGTVVLRGGSTLTTGGAANPALAAGETAASGGMVALAIFIPILAGLAGLALVIGMLFLARKLLRRKKNLVPA
jgi:hypothetical protein